MLYLKHGGHVMDDAAKDAESVARKGDVFLAGRALPKDELDKLRRMESPFDYLLPKLKADPASRLPGDPKAVVEAQNKLGTAMVDNGPPVQADPTTSTGSSGGWAHVPVPRALP